MINLGELARLNYCVMTKEKIKLYLSKIFNRSKKIFFIKINVFNLI